MKKQKRDPDDSPVVANLFCIFGLLFALPLIIIGIAMIPVIPPIASWLQGTNLWPVVICLTSILSGFGIIIKILCETGKNR